MSRRGARFGWTGLDDLSTAAVRVNRRVPQTLATHERRVTALPGKGSEKHRSLRILIVGINYAPEHSGIAPYTTEAAEHFAGQGHAVEVLTGMLHYPSWTVPEALRRRRVKVEVRNGVRVTRLRHYVPRRQTALRRAWYEISFGLHVWFHGVAGADVVIGIVPSLLGAYAASRLARRHNAAFGLWIQDLMGVAAGQSGIGGGASVVGVTTRIEKTVLRKAKAIAIVSQGFRPYISHLGVTEDRMLLLPNWSRLAAVCVNRASVRRSLGWETTDIVALHTGNMGFKQGLENLVTAAQLANAQPLTSECVRIVLVGDGNQRAHLAQLGAGVERLELLPPVEADAYPGLLSAADVLIVSERGGLRDMSLPSKLTSYFAAGRPVIAVTDEQSSTALEVRRSGAGRVVRPGDADGLLRAVRELAGDQASAFAAGQSARSHARLHLSREAGLLNCERLLAMLTAGDKGPGEHGANAPT